MFGVLPIAPTCNPVNSPYSEHDPLRLAKVAGPSTAPQYGVVEFKVDAGGTFDNPFDPEQAALDATVRCPSGQTFSVPGFFTRMFTPGTGSDASQLQPVGAPEWHVRICPPEAGAYTVLFTFRDRSGSLTTTAGFSAAPSQRMGAARVSPRDPHYFSSRDGRSMFPLGTALEIGSGEPVASFAGILDHLAASGGNFVLTSLAATGSDFRLQQGGEMKDGRGAAMIDLEHAWKLDQWMKAADAAHVACLVGIDAAEELDNRGDHPGWSKNPLNRDLGGPLRVWTEFWTNPTADRLYRLKLRYLIARYSALPSLFGWQLWSDTERIPEYDAETVRAWHERMTPTLAAMDPSHHPITTAFADVHQGVETQQLHDIDFRVAKCFNVQPAGPVGGILQRMIESAKPTLLDFDSEPSNSEKLTGSESVRAFHDAMWIGLVTGAAAICCGSSVRGPGTDEFQRVMASFSRWISPTRFDSEAFHINRSITISNRTNLWSITGNDEVLIWVQAKPGLTPEVGAQDVTLTDLASGTWNVAFWNTWTGTTTGSIAASVGLDGKVRLHLPAFSRDLAVRMSLKHN